MIPRPSKSFGRLLALMLLMTFTTAAGAVTQLQKEDACVHVVYKDLPILGEVSELAAKAALASRAQGKHQASH